MGARRLIHIGTPSNPSEDRPRPALVRNRDAVLEKTDLSLSPMDITYAMTVADVM